MSENPIVALAEKQEWLQPIQDAGASFVKEAYRAGGERGQKVKNALHGVWLGHPLHSAITDVPVGSWTAALVLDLLEAAGHEQYAPGADAAVAVGLAGAVGAAVTGLTDWSEIQGKPQRIGALHGLLNAGAALLYTGSYVCRKANRRDAGRALGFFGYGLVFAGAFLGGELAYGQRIGVNHSPEEDVLPKNFTPVCKESDLIEGQPKKVTANSVDIFLLKRGNTIYALANMCSHLGGPLAEGEVVDDTIRCPWHGSRFCLKDGSVVDGPATHSQPTFDVEIREGEVFVRAQS
jgi:nitrite reductase/ring-hydroxylating ferredoxin subunit/uncharacterized membrane protein